MYYLANVYKNKIEVSYLNICSSLLIVIDEEYNVSPETNSIYTPYFRGRFIPNWKMYSFSSIIVSVCFI